MVLPRPGRGHKLRNAAAHRIHNLACRRVRTLVARVGHAVTICIAVAAGLNLAQHDVVHFIIHCGGWTTREKGLILLKNLNWSKINT
jgi:hypothetical protein